jgi:ribosomal protein S12 methylthiotransferase
VKEERWHRFMERAQAISAAKLAAKVGTRTQVIVDRSTPRAPPAAPRPTRPRSTATSSSTQGFEALKPGDILTVEIDEASDYDLWGTPIPA